MPDIDIDFADRQKILDVMPHTRATIWDDKGIKPHNTGVYFTDIPTIPGTDQSAFDHKVAEQLGYFKLDFLNVNIYSLVKSRQHLDELINTEPPWHRLQEKEFVDQLFHLNGHYDVVLKLKPQSIEQIACCLAIIRPAKRHLLNRSWNEIYQDVWTKPGNDQYYFKKAHAVSYAMAVVVHMNLLNGS
jgi:DNA polymerase III alpha subunit